MIDGGENGADPQASGGDHHPLERVGRKDGDDVTVPTSETQQVTRRRLHVGVKLPERQRFAVSHINLINNNNIIIITT